MEQPPKKVQIGNKAGCQPSAEKKLQQKKNRHAAEWQTLTDHARYEQRAVLNRDRDLYSVRGHSIKIWKPRMVAHTYNPSTLRS